MATLKELARTCDFGHTPSGTTLTPQVILGENLRDRLVCGIAEPSIQCRLLGESNLSFDRALEIALAMESAATNTAQLHPTHNTSPSANVHNLSRKPGESDKPVQHEQSIQKACFSLRETPLPKWVSFQEHKMQLLSQSWTHWELLFCQKEGFGKEIHDTPCDWPVGHGQPRKKLTKPGCHWRTLFIRCRRRKKLTKPGCHWRTLFIRCRRENYKKEHAKFISPIAQKMLIN